MVDFDASSRCRAWKGLATLMHVSTALIINKYIGLNFRLPYFREEPLKTTGTQSEDFSEKEDCSR